MHPANRPATRVKGSARLKRRQRGFRRLITCSCPCPSRIVILLWERWPPNPSSRRVFWASFWLAGPPQHLDIAGLPPWERVHFALHPLAKGRRSVEVRPCPAQ